MMVQGKGSRGSCKRRACHVRMHRWFSSSSCSTSWVVCCWRALLRVSLIAVVCHFVCLFFFNDFPRFISVCFVFYLFFINLLLLFIFLLVIYFLFFICFGFLNENNKTKQKMCCCLAQFHQRTCSARFPAACLSCRPHLSTRWRSAKCSDASPRPNASTPLSSVESFAGKKKGYKKL